MRYAIRRTQKQVEQARKASKSPKALADLSFRELQALAVERGVNARQSAEALREKLA